MTTCNDDHTYGDSRRLRVTTHSDDYICDDLNGVITTCSGTYIVVVTAL